MKKLSSEEMKSLVIAVLLMIVGILFCCSLSIGIDGLSVIIGLILMIIGVLYLVNALVGGDGLFSYEVIIGVVVLSLGILFVAHKIAGIIFAYIPWLLIVLGCVVITEALINKFLKHDDKIVTFVIKLIVGVASIILGLCLRLIDGFMEYASIVMGILMIVYSAYLIYVTILNKNAITK